jgi:hypothetical protein
VTSRIKGPGDGPRKVGGVGGVDGPDQPGEVRPTEKTGRAQETKKTAPSDAIAKVAAQLRAGEIDVERAVELIIDHTVEKLGSGARPQTTEKLRQVLREYAANDPNLSARIRKLTTRKG